MVGVDPDSRISCYEVQRACDSGCCAPVLEHVCSLTRFPSPLGVSDQPFHFLAELFVYSQLQLTGHFHGKDYDKGTRS